MCIYPTSLSYFVVMWFRPKEELLCRYMWTSTTFSVFHFFIVKGTLQRAILRKTLEMACCSVFKYHFSTLKETMLTANTVWSFRFFLLKFLAEENFSCFNFIFPKILADLSFVPEMTFFKTSFHSHRVLFSFFFALPWRSDGLGGVYFNVPEMLIYSSDPGLQKIRHSSSVCCWAVVL